MSTDQIISVVIFCVTMLGIMTERVHRTIAATAGAVLLILTGVLTIDSSFQYVDVGTLGVLIGMMIFVTVVKDSGIFEYIAIKSAKIARGQPWAIMVMLMLVTAVLSAFLDNVTTVLLVGPMTLAITSILRVNPIPYFMTQILASNIGGTATLIGDPPNIMIGNSVGLSFLDFVYNTGPAVLMVMAVTIPAFWFVYGRTLSADRENIAAVMMLDEKKSIKDLPLLIKSVVMIVLVILGFVLHSRLGIDSCTVALTAAAVMMLIGRKDLEDTIAGVEWSTIMFFTGLFVVVGGMRETGIIDILAQMLIDATGGNLAMTLLIILWVSAIVSAFLDNIPFVATLIPLIQAMAASGMDVTPLWWAVSLGACLGGNGTIVGASANVVLTGISTKNGYPITFASYFKIGFPMMLLSMVVCTFYLLVRYA